MILLIDNYDSFSYNLYQAIGKINPNIQVVRNDQITIAKIKELAPSHIFLSPGPGRPSDAGKCIAIVKEFSREIPILGVCLGHQAICEAFGAKISYAKTLMHGKTSRIKIKPTDLYIGLPTEITVARYHSLSVVKETMPKELIITAMTKDQEIMSVKHAMYPVYGIQFHAESILTPHGKTMIANFLEENK